MSRMLMRFVNRSPSNPSTSWEPRPRTSLPIAMANSVPTRMARRVQFGPSARERITSSMMSFPIQRLATGTKTRTTRSTAVGKVSARSVRQTRTSSAGTYRIAANRSRQVSLSGVPLREAIEGSYQLSAVSYQGNCKSSRGAQRRGICAWVAWRNSGGVWLRAGEGRQGGKCRSLATLGMTSSADSDGLVAYRPMLRRSLTTLPLVFILYFSTSGGAFTTESLVREVGPGLALLILLLVPLVYSVPEVLIVGELASMLPLEGGYYRWVQRAFGPFWAFQNGWLTWMYSLVDMAIYPVLFNQYLAYFVPSLGAGARWAVSLLVIWSATAINVRGALRVGRTSIIAGTFIILGFLAIAVSALPRIDHHPWLPFAAPGHSGLNGLAVGLSIALWNYIG